MRTYIVDTHALVWYLSKDSRLSDTGRSIFQDPNAQLIIPAIVLAEIKYLGQRGRFSQTLDDVLQIIDTDPRCLVYPIDLEVIRKSPTVLDIHDSLIVGTALAQPSAIDGVITIDEAIRDSGIVAVVW